MYAQGRGIFASGSPFEDASYGGKVRTDGFRVSLVLYVCISVSLAPLPPSFPVSRSVSPPLVGMPPRTSPHRLVLALCLSLTLPYC